MEKYIKDMAQTKAQRVEKQKLSMRRLRAVRRQGRPIYHKAKIPQTLAEHRYSARKSYRKSVYGIAYFDTDFSRVKQILKKGRHRSISVEEALKQIIAINNTYTKPAKYGNLSSFNPKVPKGWNYSSWFSGSFLTPGTNTGLKGDI